MSVLVFISGLALASAFDSEIISDLVTTSADEGRALSIKAEQFWQPVRDAADDAAKADKQLSVFAAVDAAIAGLDDEHEHVRGLLRESIAHLRQADAAVVAQGTQASELANEQLSVGSGSDGTAFSFLTGGQNFLTRAIGRFVGRKYSDQLGHQVQDRQAAVLPALRGAASVTGGVLEDSRLATKIAFDVLKYDLYNRGVPKTPQAAKDAADQIIDASGKTRKRFMNLLMGTVDSIVKDTTGKHENPSATVTHAMVAGLDEPPGDTSTSMRSYHEDHSADRPRVDKLAHRQDEELIIGL